MKNDTTNKGDAVNLDNGKVTKNPAHEQATRHKFAVGDKVIVNGIPGTVEAVWTDDGKSMGAPTCKVAGKWYLETMVLSMPQPDVPALEASTVQQTMAESAAGAGEFSADFSFIENAATPPSDASQLPIWLLPPNLQRVINEVTKSYQCNRDFAVASMFGAAATALGKRVHSHFGRYHNFANLWVAIVGRSSSGKTAPLSFFFKPIEAREKETFKLYQDAARSWENANPRERGDRPVWHHHLLNNASDEKVLIELAANESMCWKTDELRTMLNGFNQYKKKEGAIVSNILSIFGNQPFSDTKVSREPIRIDEPKLDIIGGIQPNVLKRIINGNAFDEDGFMQRILYVFPDDTDRPLFDGYRFGEDIPLIWGDTIARMFEAASELIETQDAYKLHLAAYNRYRAECNTIYKDFDALAALVDKLGYYLCRWSITAAVLAGKAIIDADVMRYTIECMEYFKRCGEKVFCLIANPTPKPQEPTRGDVFKLLKKWYGDKLNQSKLGEALGVSQQAISKLFK